MNKITNEIAKINIMKYIMDGCFFSNEQKIMFVLAIANANAYAFKVEIEKEIEVKQDESSH